MKYEHEIIRDLMPLCADGIASPKSEAAVQEHIAECEECAAEWAQMQKGIDTDREEPAAQEGYVKTATRLRKKNRWVLLKVVLCTLVLVLGGYIALNYADGARFTLRSAAKYAEKYSDLLEGYPGYDPEAKRDVTVLATFKSRDGRCGIVVETIKIGEQSYLVTYSADKQPERLGMWAGSGGTSEPIDGYDEVEVMIYGDGYDNSTKVMKYALIYAKDERVTDVQFTTNGNSYAVTLDENHFGYIELPDSFDLSTEMTEGKAMDAVGRILYTTEFTGNHFVKAE